VPGHTKDLSCHRFENVQDPHVFADFDKVQDPLHLLAIQIDASISKKWREHVTLCIWTLKWFHTINGAHFFPASELLKVLGH